MPKRVVSFKPGADCEVALAKLMDRWACDRTAAIERSIMISANSLIDTVQAPTPPPTRPGPKESSSTRVDRDKILAFQNRAGMSRGGKR